MIISKDILLEMIEDIYIDDLKQKNINVIEDIDFVVED
jgi:hypothetical protein